VRKPRDTELPLGWTTAAATQLGAGWSRWLEVNDSPEMGTK